MHTPVTKLRDTIAAARFATRDLPVAPINPPSLPPASEPIFSRLIPLGWSELWRLSRSYPAVGVKKTGRISTTKRVPLISISEPCSTSAGFIHPPFVSRHLLSHSKSLLELPLRRRIAEGEKKGARTNDGEAGCILKYDTSFVFIN